MKPSLRPVTFHEVNALLVGGIQPAQIPYTPSRWRPVQTTQVRREQQGPSIVRDESQNLGNGVVRPDLLVAPPGQVLAPAGAPVPSGPQPPPNDSDMTLVDFAPWIRPPRDNGRRKPQVQIAAVSTFSDANNTRQTFLQRAMAGFLGTGNFTFVSPTVNSGVPTVVFSYQVQDQSYYADSFEMWTSSLGLLDMLRVQVDLNGVVHYGPTYLLDGKAPLSIWAVMGQTINVGIIIPSGISLVVPIKTTLDGWIY